MLWVNSRQNYFEGATSEGTSFHNHNSNLINNSIMPHSYQLFKSKEQQFSLVYGYCKKLHNFHWLNVCDIVVIIYTFYHTKYRILDELLGNDYYGLEYPLSKLFANIIGFDLLSERLKPLIKYRPKFILIHGSTQQRPHHFWMKFMRLFHHTEPHLFQLTPGFQNDPDFNDFCTRDHSPQTVDLLLIKGFERLKECISINDINTADDAQLSEYLRSASYNIAGLHNVITQLERLDGKVIVIGLAVKNDDAKYPKRLIKHDKFDIKAQIDLTCMKAKPFKEQINAIEIPLGVQLSFIEKSDEKSDEIVYHYCDAFTEIVNLGKLTRKLDKASIVLYGDDKCGKTFIAKQIALNTGSKCVIRLKFDESNSFTEKYDYESVIKYVDKVFDIAYEYKELCVIIIDDVHTLLTDVVSEEEYNDIDKIPKSNPILNALLTLIRRKQRNCKLLVIATCKYSVNINIDEYFDFVRCIPNGLSTAKEGVRAVFSNSGVDKFCVDMDMIVEFIANIASIDRKINIGMLLEQCQRIKYEQGYVDTVMIMMKNLPFLENFWRVNDSDNNNQQHQPLIIASREGFFV